MKTVHAGTHHRPDDVRIYLKECSSLKKNGIETVFVSRQAEDACFDSDTDVEVVMLPLRNTGISRFKHPIKHYNAAKKYDKTVYYALKAQNADVYHIHEYMLIKIGLKLKKETGAKIIYDIHEDVPRQKMDVYSNAKFPIKEIRSTEYKRLEKTENSIASQYDCLITATEHIKERFDKINKNVYCVPNYPIMRKTRGFPQFKEKKICYIGMISELRGIIPLVDALAGTDVTLELAGDIPASLKAKLEKSAGWKNVNYYGYVDRAEAEKIRLGCIAGVVTYLPCGNHTEALPNKIFEYMEAGLAVISSDFPSWRKIVEENNAGICVDPSNSTALNAAITELSKNLDYAKRLGENGYNAVCEKYSWNASEKILLEAYKNL